MKSTMKEKLDFLGSFTFCMLFLAWILNFPSGTQGIEDVLLGVPITIRPLAGTFMESSPGAKPGALIACQRLRIPGYSRLKNLHKFADTVRVKVEPPASSPQKFRYSNVDVCFHGNSSLELGQCAKESWHSLEKGSWTVVKSPFQTKYIDVRAIESFTEIPLNVSSQEEFRIFRVVLFLVGILLLLIAPPISKWVPFYYSSAMTLGILLLVLILLYQGMKLLPTGRKSTLYIVMYGSLVGFGTVILRYVTKLLSPIFLELGLEEGTLNPVAAFLLIGVIVMGAWLGFWGVRKLVLTDDGNVDIGTAQFVKWAIRLIAIVMLLESSVDGIFALVALLFGILISLVGGWFFRVFLKVPRLLWSGVKYSVTRVCQSPFPYKSDVVVKRKTTHTGNPLAVAPSSPMFHSPLKDEHHFFSTFHSTPRRRFSKLEWDEFSRSTTKQAVTKLVASPDFADWAVRNANRIKVVPNEIREERAEDEIELTADMEEDMSSYSSRRFYSNNML